MDEITLLSSALPDAPPPTPEAVARARARLTTHEVRRRRHPSWTLIIGASVATTAVITAVALAATLLGSPPLPVLETPKTGEHLLRELADRVEKLSPGTGAYWRVQGTRVRRYLVGTGPTRYWIASGGEMRQWTPRKPGALYVQETESSGIRPDTPRDEKIWQKQGSPDRWRLPECESSSSLPCPSITLADKRSRREYRIIGDVPDPGLGGLTIAELDALPTDPARLRERLEGYRKAEQKRGLKRSWEEFLKAAVRDMTVIPASPGLRAALLRLYVEQPGAEVAREDSDPLGRPAIAIDLGTKGYFQLGTRMVPITQEILLDPRTGEGMAERSVTTDAEGGFPKGTVAHYVVVDKMGWTDERPTLPPGCRRVKAGGVCR
ncbi:hypothetical protein SAMN05216275_114147 [Streptosporangium canum]|uniref:CU044_5270 family protein n=1 Tax=Streptosporangium canum TaxID=324952 RepID=A0A1I3VKR7_9ACTN|nr:hypothetical protein [Streptosporangium canum]SFJ95762.1 hypothetical protein SAMN05216275_114147 [Streptosporangium canum]